MREQIEQLNRLADTLCSETKGKETVSRSALKFWQDILDEMQEALDTAANEYISENMRNNI